MSYQNISSLFNRPRVSLPEPVLYSSMLAQHAPAPAPKSAPKPAAKPAVKPVPAYHQPGETMNIEWEILSYTNSADPNVWGPSFWLSLHNGAARYPMNASKIIAEKMKGFIVGMPYILPCNSCSEHAKTNVERNYHRLDDICSGRMKLFNFFVDFHNHVNKVYGKPLMAYKDAYQLYTGGVHLKKLKYD